MLPTIDATDENTVFNQYSTCSVGKKSYGMSHALKNSRPRVTTVDRLKMKPSCYVLTN